MAGDWIQMRVNLDTDPAVLEIAAMLGVDEYSVVGRLWKLWSWADQHVTDCNAIHVTRSAIDRIVGLSGFADALCKTSWLSGEDGAMCMPNLDRYNTLNAKRRAANRDRQARYRDRHSNASVTPPSRSRNAGVTPSVTPPSREKRYPRREENSNTPIVPKGDERDAGFEEFWQAYPRKVNKPRALRAWRGTAAERPDTTLLLAAIEAFRNSAAWAGDESQFIPHPASWLNGHRWDEVLSGSEKSEKKETGGPAEELWRAALEALYPEADPGIYRSWSDVPNSLREEISAAIAAAEKEAA
jgi:hypothetical protein